MMDKGRNQFPVTTNPLWIACLLCLTAGVVCAEVDENGYAVLIEQSPIHAGTVDPGLGVHKMEVGSTITLTAMPKPGYRFLYWLGAVSTPSSMVTQVEVDGPKIVVAVYERDEFELPLPAVNEERQAGAPLGGGRRRPLALGTGGGLMAASYEYDYTPFTFRRQEEPEIETDPFPVPEDSFPVPEENPIPEPNTLCLLAAGSLLFRRRRRRR